MCIALFTTAHPKYPFLLLDNRDEFLGRPTAPAQWWNLPNSHVLGGFDLFRPIHGTWLGVTRQGRIAVLTNFRDEGSSTNEEARSRGETVKSFLQLPPDSSESTEDSAKRLVEEFGSKGIGGFSLIFGNILDAVKSDEGLAVISNRTPNVEELIRVARPNETCALSNSFYGDTTWPKVSDGRAALEAALQDSVSQNEDEGALLKRLFGVLSENSMPPREKGESWARYSRQLRNSVFIPPLGNDDTIHNTAQDAEPVANMSASSATSGPYGTQKQTIVTVDGAGFVHFVERSLYENDQIEKGSERHVDRHFRFQIERWN